MLLIKSHFLITVVFQNRMIKQKSILNQLNISMSSPAQQPIVKVSSATIHKISPTIRTKLAQGSCSIYQSGGVYYLRVKDVMYDMKGLEFGEIQYQRSISYFFKGEEQLGLVHVLSIVTEDNKYNLLKEFRDTLSKHSTVYDLLTEGKQSEVMRRVKDAYPEYKEREVKSKNAVIVISKQLGKLFGSVNGMIVKPEDQASRYSKSQKESTRSQNKQGGQNPSKWGKINQKMTQKIKPVSESAKNMKSKIGHKFNHSNNSIVKAVRDISNQTKNALNQGFYTKSGLKQANHHLPIRQQPSQMYMKPMQK